MQKLALLIPLKCSVITCNLNPFLLRNFDSILRLMDDVRRRNKQESYHVFQVHLNLQGYIVYLKKRIPSHTHKMFYLHDFIIFICMFRLFIVKLTASILSFENTHINLEFCSLIRIFAAEWNCSAN